MDAEYNAPVTAADRTQYAKGAVLVIGPCGGLHVDPRKQNRKVREPALEYPGMGYPCVGLRLCAA